MNEEKLLALYLGKYSESAALSLY